MSEPGFAVDWKEPEKRPRQYAAEIINESARHKRIDLLRKVPDVYRAWVKYLVEDHFTKRNFKK